MRQQNMIIGLLIAIGLIPLLVLESGGLAAGLQVRPEHDLFVVRHGTVWSALRHHSTPLRGSLQTSLAELPLLTQSALSFVGTFSVPGQDGNGHPLTWGGYSLTYDPERQGLFFGCHDWYQRLGQIGVPTTITLTQTASILQNCTDVTEGRLALVDDYMPQLGGTLLYNNRLIVSAYGYYDADYSQVLSHFGSSPDLAVTGEVVGPYQVGEQAGIVAGYMTTIPEEWRSAFGGPALTG